MRRLIVATDSNLRIQAAFVTSEKAQKLLTEQHERNGKSVLSWLEEDVQEFSVDKEGNLVEVL